MRGRWPFCRNRHRGIGIENIWTVIGAGIGIAIRISQNFSWPRPEPALASKKYFFFFISCLTKCMEKWRNFKFFGGSGIGIGINFYISIGIGFIIFKKSSWPRPASASASASASHPWKFLNFPTGRLKKLKISSGFLLWSLLYIKNSLTLFCFAFPVAQTSHTNSVALLPRFIPFIG